MIVPLDDCIARPDDGPIRYPLVAHLREVATRAAGAALREHVASERIALFALAGLLHDAGKADALWQEYIRNPQRAKGAVPHSYMGSALFFALAWHWLHGQPEHTQRDLRPLVMRLTRDIADHHGLLADMEQAPPWESGWRPAVTERVDLAGLSDLVARWAPLFAAEWLSKPREVARRVEGMRREWGRWWYSSGAALRRPEVAGAARACVRVDTARLIASDRFSAGGVAESPMDVREALQGLDRLAAFCSSRTAVTSSAAATCLTRMRAQAQEEAVLRFRQAPDRPLYKLSLPTGMGKTLTATRVALEAVLRGRSRVIYVAPYLSVLSQAAAELSRATGLPVLQHHHLSVPPAGSETLSPTEKDFLVMESWQAPVVATTFNQFFLSLFPLRAQHTIRLLALQDAFVIVDEPQVIDERAWALFCAMVEAATERLHMQVLLVTATMPPWRGLLEPHDLSAAVAPPDRYQVRVSDRDWDVAHTAANAVLCLKEGQSTAVILNTIADATEVYREAKRLLAPDSDVVTGLVHGAMIPVHRRHTIDRIREQLVGKRVLAIATQVLEAGVDLSFGALLRALPLLPSVTQAAGRANRHAEAETPAPVTVFRFVRGEPQGQTGVLDTRVYVYRDGIAREETDRILLADAKSVGESRLRELTEEYYRRLFSRKPAVGVAEALSRAAAGEWSAIAGIPPFPEDRPRIPVFVPIDEWNTDAIMAELQHFGVRSSQELYASYQKPGWVASLDHGDRRRLFALMEQFIVPLDYEKASTVIDRTVSRNVFPLVDLDAYDREVGFGKLVTGETEALFL